MTLRARWLVVLAVIVLSGPATAHEACDDAKISGPARLTITERYSPFAETDLTSVGTITIVNLSDAACPLAVVFAADDGGKLRRAGEAIDYALETLGGATLLNPLGAGDPQTGAHLDLTLAGQEAASLSLRARVRARQMASPGRYTDSTAVVRLYYVPQTGFPELLREKSFPVSADIPAVCQLSPPQPATLDFTADIGADARPLGAWHNTQMPYAACNTGARVRLSANALQRGGEAPVGFDKFIDFEARAVFRSATATLLTQGAAARSAQSAHTHGDGSEDEVRVQVRLIPRRPLSAGRYQSVLTITLEPSP